MVVPDVVNSLNITRKVKVALLWIQFTIMSRERYFKAVNIDLKHKLEKSFVITVCIEALQIIHQAELVTLLN